MYDKPRSSPTWWMATMLSCSRAAAARASRRKRCWRPFAQGQVRQHGLDRDLAAKRGVLAEKDHAHAAVAEHLEDAIITEPAQLFLRLRRRQEVGQAAVRHGVRRREISGASGSAERGRRGMFG